MLLQMGPFHALKGKVEHNDEKTDVAMAYCDEIVSEETFLLLNVALLRTYRISLNNVRGH